jgi:DNA-binding NtrC family response regulator
MRLAAAHLDGAMGQLGDPGQAPAGGAPGPVSRTVAAAPRRSPDPAPSLPLRPLPEQVAALERRAMAEALHATGGNRMAAARLLKVSRAAFYDKLARYPELTAPPSTPARS